MRLALGLLCVSVIAHATPNDYTNASNWLCRPASVSGKPDACTVDETATIVAPDGSVKAEAWRADPQAPVDCFYVYPTVSREQSLNSDMTPGPGEIGVASQQAARFASACRVYAPLYRQITLAGLRSSLTGGAGGDRQLAYDDVRDAWNEYLAHDNQGRGVVLIGHSQGSKILTALLQHEIEGKPIQKQIISALLAGETLQVPVGKDVGGDLKSMPLCRSTTQTGCVVAFSSFRANAPPPPRTRFGHSNAPGMAAACVNPAAPAGGKATLHSYLRAQGSALARQATPTWTTKATVTTPFVALPGLISGKCESNEHFSYLAITVHGDPTDPRTDDINGDFIEGGAVLGGWGLHLIDMHLVMGDLIALVQSQSKAWLKAKH